jgi:hypothetical protein
MLKDEENAKYRSVIKNTLEFNPNILKRFVNYMTNPDEQTAINQFGQGDKYFGICTLMVTLPGLPMFGHGQYEGYSEKYGMEYARSYWNEQENKELIERHNLEIRVIMKHRNVFSGIEQFTFYDFYTSSGIVNENIFAFSNTNGKQSAVIIFNNKYEESRGWVRTSVTFKDITTDALIQKSLGEAIKLTNEENYYCIFSDKISGIDYIRKSRDIWEQGLYIELNAYKYHVFMDFIEISSKSDALVSLLSKGHAKGLRKEVEELI